MEGRRSGRKRSQHYLKGLGKFRKALGYSMFWLRFDLGTSRMQLVSITDRANLLISNG